MKSTVLSKILPDKFLTKMSAADRAQLGKAGMTAAEAQQVVEYRYEKDFQKHIIGLLNQRGIFFIQSAFHKRTTIKAGTPDFVFAIKGQACAIEAKVRDGKLTDEQEAVHAAMMRNGWRVAVCRNLSEVQEFLNAQ